MHHDVFAVHYAGGAVEGPWVGAMGVGDVFSQKYFLVTLSFLAVVDVDRTVKRVVRVQNSLCRE